jgi:hypothetical protein
MVFLLLSCNSEPADDCRTGERKLWVMRSIEFARFEGDEAAGFDLDDDEGKVCGHEDWTAPWGAEGVDNNLARLIPALESTEAVAVEAILLQTINRGELLILVETDAVDDPFEDRCVDATLMRGLPPVEVGTDDLLLPGQTLEIDPDAPSSPTYDGHIRDGVLHARGIQLSLPFQVLNEPIDFDISDGQLRMEVDEETGLAQGVAGGGVHVPSLLAMANDLGIDDEVKGLLNSVLPLMADLDADGDGECESLSIAFHFEAIPAWRYE